MKTFSRDYAFGGPFASVGTTVGKHSPSWRLHICTQCGAVPHERCFRLITERVSEMTGIFQGEGRKSYLKHPHPVRKAKNDG